MMKSLWLSQQKQLLTMSDLKKIRVLIDKLDKQIIKLLNERGKLAQEIKKAKKLSDNKNIFRPEREAQILRSLSKSNKGPLTNENLQIIFREIISSCLSLEKKLKVSCLGPKQSYSNIALTKFFGSAVEVNFHSSINSIFDDVKTTLLQFAAPILSSWHGGGLTRVAHWIKLGI